MPSRIQLARDNAAVCDGITEQDFEAMRYEAVMNAAKLGNPDARVCAVKGDFDVQKMSNFSDQDRQQFQIDAMLYFDQSLKRGDWRVVQAMLPSWRPFARWSGFLFASIQGDELTEFRMLTLLKYGAIGQYADTLDLRLKRYDDAQVKGSERFDPQSIADGKAWAKEQYEKYFQNSPKFSEAPSVCGDFSHYGTVAY